MDIVIKKCLAYNKTNSMKKEDMFMCKKCGCGKGGKKK